MSMKTDLTPVQKRRRTMFPLSSKVVNEERVGLAGWLEACGYSVRAIRQILNLPGPEHVRRLLAKRNRLNQIYDPR